MTPAPASLDASGDSTPQDLIIIGAGVMGLFTAYYASARFDRITLVDRSRVGDPLTASYGRTRSVRRDYLDPEYARLADEAIRLWRDFETDLGVRALVRCGVLNVADERITPDLGGTYAKRVSDVMRGLGLSESLLPRDELKVRYPYLEADLGQLDEDAGVADLATITSALMGRLAERGVRILEEVDVPAIRSTPDLVTVTTTGGVITGRSLVITAGHGTNDLLAALEGCTLQIPLSRDRPAEARYYRPPAEHRHLFTSDVMPVMAYLDSGIYLHPIVEGVTDAVKIGFYNPPDVARGTTVIEGVGDFVSRCLPTFEGFESEPVADVDQCDYDMVADDDFVLGPVPGFANVHVGVGWRGTGYKYAPWVGRVLFELGLLDGSVYSLDRFQPARFGDVLDTRAVG